MSMSKFSPFVAIVMGSASDLATMRMTQEVLNKFHIPNELKIASAHRTPDALHTYVEDAERRGCTVFIAAAGLAAHLAGAIAARTIKPVIGVPLESGSLHGIDALLSTVQMPSGIPVATVAIGTTGAKNAAFLAAQIMAGSDLELAERLLQDRAATAAEIIAKDVALGNS